MTAKKRDVKSKTLLLFVLFIAIFFIPAGLGFMTKLYEFFVTAGTEAEGRYEDGRFAIIPAVNYVLVFLGMLSLLFWAISNGMFKDVERPKYTMLDNEKRLDEQAGYRWD